MRSSSNKKQNLLSSAHSLFLEHGFYGVKVESICSSANTGKGTFFYYFPTKEYIVKDLLEMQLKDLSNNLYQELISSAQLPIDQLKYFFEYLLSPMALTPECIKYFNMYELPAWFESELEHQRSKYFYPIFYELIQLGMRMNYFALLNDNVSSEMLYIGIQRYVHNHRNSLNDIVVLNRIASTIQNLVEKTLSLPSNSLPIVVN